MARADVNNAIRQLLADIAAYAWGITNTKSAKDYGAIGDGVTDDTAALATAFASGALIDGLGLTYKVVPATIIDTYSGAGVGYGLNKNWFLAGACRNMKFIGDVSFAPAGNFLGKHKFLNNVEVTGDARIASWYCCYQGFKVSGTTYMGSDYPPTQNALGFYYNDFAACDFDAVIIDQRYGPCNNNTFGVCQFNTIYVKNTGDAGYSVVVSKDFHLNTFIACEWFTPTGILAPDSRYYPFVVDDAANVGGINRIIGCYMENAVRGFYGPGFEIENIHTSGASGGITISSKSNLVAGYSSPLSGEAGYNSRDAAHIYPMGNVAMGGDWSILGTNAIPLCFSTAVTTAVVADAQEPSGLGKAVQFTGGATATVDILPQVNDTGIDNLFAFGVLYKNVTDSATIVTYDAAGAEVYGAANQVFLDNDWILAHGHTYGNVRFTSANAWSAKISAVAMGRGAGIVSPFTQQRADKALIDMSGGASIFRDAVNSSGMGRYEYTQSKSMTTAGGNYDYYSVSFGNGEGCTIELSYTINGSGGARYYRNLGYLVRDGAGVLTYTDSVAAVVAGGASTFTIVIAAGVATIRSTVPEAAAQTGVMSIRLLGGHIGPSSVTVL